MRSRDVFWTLFKNLTFQEDNFIFKDVCPQSKEKHEKIFYSFREKQIAIYVCVYILDVYYTGKHGMQENEMKWARNFSHFPGICGVSPYENHMTAGRLACQLKHVQLDLTELCVCQFITGILIQF